VAETSNRQNMVPNLTIETSLDWETLRILNRHSQIFN